MEDLYANAVWQATQGPKPPRVSVRAEAAWEDGAPLNGERMQREAGCLACTITVSTSVANQVVDWTHQIPTGHAAPGTSLFSVTVRKTKTDVLGAVPLNVITRPELWDGIAEVLIGKAMEIHKIQEDIESVND